MSTQQDTQTTETVHVTAEHLTAIRKAYGVTDSSLCQRALAVARALAYNGDDVKILALDLADAHRADDSVPAVSQATLGYARFASTAADMIGVSLSAWVRTSPGDVADAIRAAQRVGIKVAKANLRDALAPLTDDASAADRGGVAHDVFDDALATILPAKVSTPRLADTASESPAAVRVSGVTDAASALAAVRDVTAWLQDGGAFSADLASAVASLTTGLSAARKRGAASPTPATVARVGVPAAV